MMYEIVDCKQYPGEKLRRWFEDDFFDLIVWFEDDGTIYGFQLCYDRKSNERALTWINDRGFDHAGVDYGDHYHNLQTPILVSDGPYNAEKITLEFLQRSRDIGDDITSFIAGKLVSLYE